MWTAGNNCIGRPQIWDLLSHHGRGLDARRLVPAARGGLRGRLRLHARPHPQPRRLGIALVLHPADRVLRAAAGPLGHFPLMNYWGPLAGLPSSAWIADSAVIAAQEWQPDFFYIYLPHLDYAAQRTGPDSAGADQAVADLDEVIGRLAAGMAEASTTNFSGWWPANTRSRRWITSAIRTASSARPAC